jgi:type II restriction enzyme
MDLSFQPSLAEAYVSSPQRIRILSEHWVGSHVYCPNCGNIDIGRYANNSPVADFFCNFCAEDYELKAQKHPFGSRVVNGAYRSMLERLNSARNPNLFLLNYDLKRLEVLNFLIVPKHFLIPDIIEKRKPLAMSARRAGWTGCNILLKGIPRSGQIFVIKNQIVASKNDVIASWRRTLFLREQRDLSAKGWLVHVMLCIERLKLHTFSLDEIYKFESDLAMLYPSNRNVRPKIRQQLQILRVRGYLEFVGKGTYRLTESVK